MKQYTYIEDLIMLLGPVGITWPSKTLIRLARYDVNICESLAEQVQRQQGFTDRQAVLAHKIVVKYRKQWAQNDIDITNHLQNAQFRLPIRHIDRSKSVQVQQNKIIIKFAYDEKIINDLRQGHEIPGQCVFDKTAKHWICDAVEPRIMWIHDLAEKHGFDCDPQLATMVEEILKHQDFQIKLTEKDGAITITNAESYLTDYLNQRVGFNWANLTQLIDLSTVCGYTVDNQLLEKHYGTHALAAQLATQRQVHVQSLADVCWQDFRVYMNHSHRQSVCVYLRPRAVVEQIRQAVVDLGLEYVEMSSDTMPDPEKSVMITDNVFMMGYTRQRIMQMIEKFMVISDFQ